MLEMFCDHRWFTKEISNVVQYDNLGYPLRLVIRECGKCRKIDQHWVPVPQDTVHEENGDVVLVWMKVV